MSDSPRENHIEERAELLPEEERAGSEDPHDQAEQILRESEERTDDPEGTGRQSTQTSTPNQRPGPQGANDRRGAGPGGTMSE